MAVALQRVPPSAATQAPVAASPVAARPVAPRPPALPLPAPACCEGRADDALAVALAARAAAPSGTLLDVGCGTGEVGLSVLRARSDVEVVGVDVSLSRCRRAAVAARARGVDARFLALVGSVFDVTLPRADAVVANPPMLPTEPGFSVPAPDGRPRLFWVRLLSLLAAWPEPPQVWLHLFDFHGVHERTGLHPSLPEVAAELGFEPTLVHRGWRAAGPASSITKALPALRRVFPQGIALHDGLPVAFRDLPASVAPTLLTPHSVVHLRPVR